MKIKLLDKISNFTLDTLFPISCLGCGKPDTWFCPNCLSKIPLTLNQFCPLCEKVITPNGYTCFSCRKKYSIDGILASSSYKNKLLAHSIHLYKYRFIEKLSEPLGEILAKAVLNSGIPLPDLIIPVPLHKRRLRSRGFNQSEMLARYLEERISPGLQIPIFNSLLTRNRFTSPQMKIKSYGQRIKNIQGAFAISRKDVKFIKDKRIFLIDDIATTGATLFECAETLKRKGAKEVFGIILARQELKKL